MSFDKVWRQSASQPQVYTTAVLLPEHPRSTLLPADTLVSQGLGDIVMVGGDKSLVKQKPSIPKHQVAPKSQIKVRKLKDIISPCQNPQRFLQIAPSETV